MDEFSRYYVDNSNKTQYDEHYFERKNKDIRILRNLSIYSGLAVLLYVIIQNGIVILIQKIGLWQTYIDDAFFRSGVDILMTLFGIMLPFSLVGRKMKKYSGEKVPVPIGRPKNIRLFIFGVVGATGFIMLANIVSSYAVYFASLIGYKLEAPDIAMPTGFLGFAVSILRVAVLAAVVEEYCLRGIVMGNLRRYGEGFAIAMAAAVFSLMHGNLVQVPFALLSGIALGYFAVKTGTIWTAVIAHGINNALSISVSYLQTFLGEEASSVLYMYVIYALIFAGMFCTFVFAMNTKGQYLKKSKSVLTVSEKITHFIFTPTMFLAFCLMVYITAGSISK